MDSILIIAGENSGEKYGADLVHQFKKLHPSLSFFGIGGKHMEREGVNLLFPVEELAVVGVFEIISHLPRIKKIFNKIKREIKRQKPSAAVLIDSPDFNLRLAKKLKKLSIPVLYYISPTVWAWRKGRLKTIKKTVDKMMLIFPFEEKIYEDYGIPAVYVGHPLKERVKTSLTKNEFLEKHGLSAQKKLISLLPGSRRSELKYHLPVLAEALERIKNEWDTQFVLLLAESFEKNFLLSLIPPWLKGLKILSEDHYEAIASSDLVLSACGTANLEAALLETPLVSFYRISPLTYFFGHRLATIKNFSIVNILAGERIIPELIQRDFTPQNIFEEIKKIFDSEEQRSGMITQFRRIKKLLGDKTAPQNAAQELGKLIKQKQDTAKRQLESK
ncbi:MAG TPA: lipid-A-disaccharide synthase [Candidatus Aminicenantes bacterium]|nr:lipid-A-disaccharide synthase [Candidatus Aminicenantes bacterium]